MRMSDLIDREALLRQIDIDSEGEPGYYGDTWKFIDTIKSMPPAELSTNLASLGTDAISRQAVKELAHNQMREKYCGMALKKQRDFYIKLADSIIDLLPSIQPKRGRWHYSDGKPARIGLSFGVICDQCGTESEYCTNFCGECGADMRQREE
jgi:hypothetical protein